MTSGEPTTVNSSWWTDGNVTAAPVQQSGSVPAWQLYSYVLIGTIGVLDNGIVVFVLGSTKALRSKIVNMFLINQSLLDLVTAFFVAATANNDQLGGGHSGFWGQLYCRVWVFKIPMWATFMSSTYNLLAMSIERYLAVCRPIFHKVSFTRGRALVIIILTWFIGPLENFTVNGITSDIVDGYCRQMINWPAPWVSQFTGVLIVVVEFFLPISIMIVAYTRMIIAMRTRVAPGSTEGTDETPAQQRQRERSIRIQKNILRTLLLVVACFFFCWVWNQVYFLLFNLNVHRNLHSPFFHFTVYAAFINSIINPFVYAAQYQDFKHQARKIFRIGSKKGGVNQENSTAVSQTT